MKWLSAMISSALAATILFGGGPASAEPTAPKVDVGGGTAIEMTNEEGYKGYCTLTAIGEDDAGNLVGLTAGHCGEVGFPVAAEHNPEAGTLGTFVHTNHEMDYAVIEFDPAKVNPVRTVGDARIGGIATEYPNIAEVVCKQGRTTGFTCGAIAAVDEKRIYAYQLAWQGDSGGPVLHGDKLVGMGNTVLEPWPPGSSGTNRIDWVLKDIDANSAIGVGFELI